MNLSAVKPILFWLCRWTAFPVQEQEDVICVMEDQQSHVMPAMILDRKVIWKQSVVTCATGKEDWNVQNAMDRVNIRALIAMAKEKSHALNVEDMEDARIVPKQGLLHAICVEEQESIVAGALALEPWNARHVMVIRSVKHVQTIQVPVIVIAKHAVIMAKSDATDAMATVMKHALNVVDRMAHPLLIQTATVVTEPVRCHVYVVMEKAYALPAMVQKQFLADQKKGSQKQFCGPFFIPFNQDRVFFQYSMRDNMIAADVPNNIIHPPIIIESPVTGTAFPLSIHRSPLYRILVFHLDRHYKNLPIGSHRNDVVHDFLLLITVVHCCRSI